MQDYNAQIRDLFEKYEPLSTNEEDRALLEKTKSQWNQYLATSSGFLESSRSNNDAAIKILNGAAWTIFNGSLPTALTERSSFTESFATQDVQEAARIFQRTERLTIGLLIGASLLAIIGGFLLARSIAAPIALMTGAATNIGLRGDLNRDIPVEVKQKLAAQSGEIGQLAQALNCYGAEHHQDSADHKTASHPRICGRRDQFARQGNTRDRSAKTLRSGCSRGRQA
jgi:methyl-accepting chemotaxis protein